MAAKIVLLGYYGFGNLGDEAVCAGIIAALRETLGAPAITVLSGRPAESEQLHPGTTGADRWQWRTAAAALRNTDLFVLGGGSLLQDATSARSVVWYALMALLARRRARRVLWWGQGIGPLRTPLARRLVRLIARQADAITVRDMASGDLLKAIGARGSIEVVADPAFILEPPVDVSAGADSSLLLALRSWKNNELRQALGANGTLAAITDLAGGKLTVFPMHLPDDAAFSRALLGEQSARFADWKNQTPVQALGAFVRTNLVIAMRLHALIFAARCATPFVAISYDPKVDALVRACGQQDALLSVNALSGNALIETTEMVLATRAQRAQNLAQFAQDQAVRARRPAQIAAGWLGT